MTTVAEVRLWGRQIGAVSIRDGDRFADFEYTPEFVGSGIQVAPITMPLSRRLYRFPTLALETFHGLSGLLADSLPDKFGHALIDAWLATQRRPPGSLNAVERLCYTGSRGMGALEFRPTLVDRDAGSEAINLDALVDLASQVLQARHDLMTTLDQADQSGALRNILQVGTSAGGARAKAVIAWRSRARTCRRIGRRSSGCGMRG